MLPIDTRESTSSIGLLTACSTGISIFIVGGAEICSADCEGETAASPVTDSGADAGEGSRGTATGTSSASEEVVAAGSGSEVIPACESGCCTDVPSGSVPDAVPSVLVSCSGSGEACSIGAGTGDTTGAGTGVMPGSAEHISMTGTLLRHCGKSSGSSAASSETANSG